MSDNYVMMDDYEPIMPDGYQEGDDILADADSNSSHDLDALFGAEESDTTTAEEAAETPATESAAETTEGDQQPETAPATEPVVTETAEKPKLRFNYKFDREERQAELDEADLPDVYERAMATDRYRDRLNQMSPVMSQAEQLARTMGYKDAHEMISDAAETYRKNMIEQLVNDGTPRLLAEDYVDRKMGRTDNSSPAEQPQEEQAANDAPAQASASRPARDYAAEAAQLLELRPQLQGKQLPDEVMKDAVENGVPLVAAYLKYESQQNNAELERLRNENRIYKQNAEAASRSPVKPTTGGGETDTKPSDPFLEGFNGGYY